jgi:accessory secretory protein Asp1
VHPKIGKVEVSPEYKDRFQKTEYDTIEDFLQEALKAYLQKRNNKADTIVLALDKQHNQLVQSALGEQRLILSLYEGRVNDSTSELVERAEALFTDKNQSDQSFQNLPSLTIYPFDKRLVFGESENEADLYISLFTDNLSLEEIDEAVSKTMKQLKENENTRLLLCTFQYFSMEYLQQIRAVAGKYLGLLKTEGEDAKEEKIQVVLFNREIEVIQTIAKSRVFLDLGEELHKLLKIEAISAGVPQINRAENAYCFHLKNGYRVKDFSEIEEALSYFLVGLKNWDDSLVYSDMLRAMYSDAQILANWEKMKEGFGHEGSSNRAE